MRVAVISSRGGQEGKSSLIVLLSILFVRTQGRRVSILSTGSMKELLNTVILKGDLKAAKSVSVFKTIIEGNVCRSDELEDYAYRIGEEGVCAFDLFSSLTDVHELDTVFHNTLEKLNADLVLIEVNGDLNEERNKAVLDSTDAILYVFNHSCQSIADLKGYRSVYDQSIVRRTGYICQKYDEKVLGEKKLGKLLGVNARNLMVFPYNPVIVKESIDGKLDTVARFVCQGHHEVVGLRSRIMEIMQFLFDSPDHKYIKEVSEWRR